MYIRTPPSDLGQPTKAGSLGKLSGLGFNSGGEYVGENDGEKLLAVLAGKSDYQNYILPIMAVQGSKLPKKLLRIVSSPKGVPDQRLRSRFASSDNKLVGGTVDRRTGTIYLMVAPGARSHSRLEYALHEAVHLFSHPFMSIVSDQSFQQKYGQPCHTGQTDVGTFQRKYCRGFGEGATQLITEQIMEAQTISKYYRDRPYDEFTAPVKELVRIFSLDKFARAYFWGEVKQFTEALESRWGPAWRNVANFTSTKNTRLALAEIEKLEKAYERRRKIRFKTHSIHVKFA